MEQVIGHGFYPVREIGAYIWGSYDTPIYHLVACMNIQGSEMAYVVMNSDYRLLRRLAPAEQTLEQSEYFAKDDAWCYGNTNAENIPKAYQHS